MPRTEGRVSGCRQHVSTRPGGTLTMSGNEGPGDDIRVSIGGSVQEGGQVGVGRNISQRYVRTHNDAPTVTEADLAELRRMVGAVKAQIVAEVPPEQQAAALDRVDELQEAVVADEPDL